MTARRPPEARMCDDGEIIVRGVHTFEEAIDQAIADLLWDELGDRLATLDDEFDAIWVDGGDDIDEHLIARGRSILTNRYQADRIGWWRYNPCNESMCGDHGRGGWHLAARSGPGPGNWHGVLLTPTAGDAS